nr:ulp1 protease family, C-terminal catalytic domain-containing protein [Tanacetum cinerariifolium]
MYNIERATLVYIKGLSEFIKTVEDHQANTKEARISCPCKDCAYFICHDDIETIRFHLFKHGFTDNYTRWKHHGEARRDCTDVVLESNVNNNNDNCGSSNQNINDTLHDVEHNAELDMVKLQQFFVETEKPLYSGCTNFTKLSAVLQFLTVKAEYGFSDGPKQPVNDIDVYLELLIDDMIDLWDKGVEVYDAYKKERFKLFAMIFCTISDFLTYGNLSAYGTKGKKACPVCEKDTHSRWLTNYKKTVYMGH